MAGSSKAKTGSDHTPFGPGDIVLGKIKGYPPWPGILCHEDNVPKANVLSARPGKNYHIVRFFPAADYGFNKTHELKRLSKREVEAFLSDPHKRAAELREAYKLALDPEAWNAEKDEAVRKAEEEDEGEDMLEGGEEDEEDEEEDVQPAAKKRKAPAAATRKESVTAGNKKPKSEPRETKKQPATASVAKASGRTDSADADGGDEVELDPETKKVKGWRHTLQRGFLPKDGHIAGDGMEQHDATFKEVEEYRSISIAQLRLTKIGKVMKRIAQLHDIPRDDVYQFRKRAQALCEKWGELLQGGGGGGGGGGSTSGAEDRKADVKDAHSAGTVNGTSNGAKHALAVEAPAADSTPVVHSESSTSAPAV